MKLDELIKEIQDLKEKEKPIILCLELCFYGF